MNLPRQIAQRTQTKSADWLPVDGPETRVGADYFFRHRLSGKEVGVNVDQGHPTFAFPEEGAEFRPLFSDNFAPVDAVGQSEYRSLIELLADSAGVPNVAGDVDTDATISEEQRDHMMGVINELIAQARSAARTLRNLQF